jgi:hypothetical protein
VAAIHDNTSIVFAHSTGTGVSEYILNALETRVHKYKSLPPNYWIESSQPVAVFSGLYCTSNDKCTNIVEQIPPYNELDTVYIIPPNYNTVVTILAFVTKERANVTLPRNRVIALSPGRARDHILHSDEAAVIRSTGPLLMTSYAYSKSIDYNPYWTIVPGLHQYLPRYKIVIPTGYNTNYIAVMITASAVDGLRTDCESIDPNTVRFQKSVFVDDVEYSVIVAEVIEGELTLETIDDTPFGLMVYGHRERGGYGFAGNVILRR